MRWREPHAAAGTGQVAHHIAQHPPAPPLPTSSVALSIDQVQVWLGGRMVLHDVDLQVRRGELVGLIGPNGAGKTTVLRSVLGLVPLTQGSVTVHPRLGDSSARVGYVPQRHDFAWDYPISIQEAVVAARTPYRSWWRRTGIPDVVAAATALHRVGLYELRSRPVGELSGGQRQRVLIARALAVEPSVLLLDEPMTGLDVPSQDSLHSLFSDLAAEGEALLMTTHDIPSALTLCDRLLLLQGTVVAAGPPADLGDPQLWMRTFGVGPESSLVSVVQACVPRPISRPHGHKVLL